MDNFWKSIKKIVEIITKSFKPEKVTSQLVIRRENDLCNSNFSSSAVLDHVLAWYLLFLFSKTFSVRSKISACLILSWYPEKTPISLEHSSAFANTFQVFFRFKHSRYKQDSIPGYESKHTGELTVYTSRWLFPLSFWGQGRTKTDFFFFF